jgi:asparagine synthase (glutamine-hydrolysing)
MVEALRHRGPDDSGEALLSVRIDGVDAPNRAWLGHRRLSIIDVSTRARQPMESSDGRFVIVFNGEIYNYVELREQCRARGCEFRTGSDTEVLLVAWSLWGVALLSRLKGMFAFVIVDRSLGVATLVRDHFGIKPLYVAETDTTVYVSSEPLPLLRLAGVDDGMNPDIVFGYLRFGATRDIKRTILRGVQTLPPAHIATFEFASGVLRTAQPYWSPRAGSRLVHFADAVAECRERFVENVRLHLRSDVPVGAALSGGVDSSAIVCAMRQLEPDVDLRTFSFISSDRAKSEERWVDLVHERVGGTCFKVCPEPSDLGSDMEDLVRCQGEPFASASIYAQYRVFKKAREMGVSVTLDGQGADELLGGYWPYVGTSAAALLRRGDFVGAVRLMIGSARGTDALRLVASLAGQSLLPKSARSFARRIAGKRFVPRYFAADWLADANVNAFGISDAMVGRYSDLKAHLVDTLSAGSLSTLLRYADRNSMAFGVESRVPFLTHDFAEFLLALPSEYLVSRDGTRKHVFREAMRNVLPEAIRIRPDKIGFVADDAVWLRASRNVFADAASECRDLPIFNGRALTRFLTDFWEGKHSHALLVWRVVVFAYWLREMERVRAMPRLGHGCA